MNIINGQDIAELLLKSGEINEVQLREARAVYEEKKPENAGKNLPQVLKELGYITEETFLKIEARQKGLSHRLLNEFPADPTLKSIISPDVARRYKAFPLGFENGAMVMAMDNPADIVAAEDLRIITGNKILPVQLSEKDFYEGMENFIKEDIPEEDTAEESDIITTDEGADIPVVKLANKIFNQAVQAGASDVHIEPQEKNMRVRLRIDGVLHEVMQDKRKIHPSLVSRVKVMANMDIAERRMPQDGRFTMKVENKIVDVRVASLPSAHGEKLTMRLLNRSARLITLEEMGFPATELDKYKNMMKTPYGFLLVTGPTGSGKSTTMYATLEELNTVEKNIITVEDPIEYRMDGINQIQVNSRAGLVFATGLRSILRNDPDIIMIGEIRDHETARIAVESSLTGHLVLSTLHTNDAASAINRLADMGIEPYLISSSIIGVLAQRLARVLCNRCKEENKLNRREILNSFPDFPLEEGEDIVTFYRPMGCMYCNNTGYKGRIGVYELLKNSESIQNLTLNRASSAEIIKTAISEGMTTLQQDGLKKVKQGITAIEEIIRVIA